jgi:hypothetical protein
VFAVNKKVKRLQIRFQELTAFLPLLLVVGMFENSEGALQQVTQSKNSDLPGLRLNELLASNRTGILDDEGRSSDWVEIYNPGTGAIRLGRYYLTNDPKTLDK